MKLIWIKREEIKHEIETPEAMVAIEVFTRNTRRRAFLVVTRLSGVDMLVQSFALPTKYIPYAVKLGGFVKEDRTGEKEVWHCPGLNPETTTL